MSAAEELSGEELIRQGMEALQNDNVDSFIDNIDSDDSQEDVEAVSKEDSHGYMSKEEWVAKGNDPDDYLTKEQFDEVGRKRDSDATRTQLAKDSVMLQSQVQEILRNQQEMAERIKKEAYEKAKSEFEGKLTQAKDIGDVDAALEAQSELNRLESQQNTGKKPDQLSPHQQKEDEFIKNWTSSNTWYGSHQGATDMMAYLLKVESDKGTPIEQGFANAQARVAQRFDYLFDDIKPSQQTRPAAVTETTRRPAAQTKKVYRLSDLEPELQGVARQMIKKTGISESDYVKGLLEK